MSISSPQNPFSKEKGFTEKGFAIFASQKHLLSLR
jgi:hypothetical protein